MWVTLGQGAGHTEAEVGWQGVGHTGGDMRRGDTRRRGRAKGPGPRAGLLRRCFTLAWFVLHCWVACGSGWRFSGEGFTLHAAQVDWGNSGQQ